VDIWSSTAWKGVINTIDNGTPTAVATIGGKAGDYVTWRPPHPDFMNAATTGAGVQGFRVNITNLDNSEASDAHVTFHYAAE